MSSESIKLHSTQIAAINGCLNLLSSVKVAVLAGAAGTGKSTCAKMVASEWSKKTGGNTIYLAPTGKAALRLSETTGQVAKTIHSAIYGAVDESEEKDEHGKVKASKMHFGDPHPPKDCTLNTLVIVDESSMLTEKLTNELKNLVLKAGGCLLFMGDHEQLPPVMENPTDMPGVDLAGSPNKLTVVFRQKEGSPVLDLATRIRQGGDNDAPYIINSFERYNDEVRLVGYTTTWDIANYYVKYCPESYQDKAVICCSNQVRQWVNGNVRTISGFKFGLQAEERVLNFKNKRLSDSVVYNGEQGTVEKVFINKKISEIIKLANPEICNGNYNVLQIDVKWDGRNKATTGIIVPEFILSYFENKYIKMPSVSTASRLFFSLLIPDSKDKRECDDSEAFKKEILAMGMVTENELDNIVRAIKGRGMILNYGYTLTAHKSQGSQWKNVVVVSDGAARKAEKKWFYTAITRSQGKLTILDWTKLK